MNRFMTYLMWDSFTSGKRSAKIRCKKDPNSPEERNQGKSNQKMLISNAKWE